MSSYELTFAERPKADRNLKTGRFIKGMTPHNKGKKWSERNFELNLREDYKRKTTFMSDFPIAEWYGKDALVDTLKKAVSEWKDNIEYMAELILVLNSKSWEMDSRLHEGWCRLYAELYYIIRDFYFDYFKGNSEAMQYYYDYID